MAVPRDALALRRKCGRKGNALRIRRKIPVDDGRYCGTVITVPYGLMNDEKGPPYGRPGSSNG